MLKELLVPTIISEVNMRLQQSSGYQSDSIFSTKFFAAISPDLSFNSSTMLQCYYSVHCALFCQHVFKSHIITAPTSSAIFVCIQVSSVHPQTKWRSEIEMPGYIVLPTIYYKVSQCTCFWTVHVTSFKWWRLSWGEKYIWIVLEKS